VGEHSFHLSLDEEPDPAPWRSGGSWAELRPHLPARALPIVAVYDEVWPDRVPRTSWQVWYSGRGDLRVADPNGDPVWIVRSDDVSYWDIVGDVASCTRPDSELETATKEPAKPARVMLEPRALDDFWDVEDYTFGCAALDAAAPLITMRDAAGVPALYLELDPSAGLIRRITSPDLTPDDFRLELRDYRVADSLPAELFSWTGEIRAAT
jgi:hypothetical protein